MLQVPQKDLCQRYFQNGVTAYSYEEIKQTIEEANAVDQEYLQLEEKALQMAEPYDTGLGTHCFAPQTILDLLILLNKIRPESFFEGSVKFAGKQEKYPVKTWKKQIISYRSKMKKIQKAMEACK